MAQGLSAAVGDLSSLEVHTYIGDITGNLRKIHQLRILKIFLSRPPVMVAT